MDRVTSASFARIVEQTADSKMPLDRLRRAVGVVDALHDVSEEVLDRFVAEARAGGCSWTQIGAVLGVSKQAAQQRFPSTGSLQDWPEGVADVVRAALGVAQDDARTLGHEYIGTEHLLLGLAAQTDGLAADVLRALGVTREAILSRTREIVGTAAPRPWEALGVAPRLKRVLQLSHAEAARLGHSCANTEHVLLAIARLDDGVAASILRDLDASPTRVREEIAKRLDIDSEQLDPPPRRRARLLRRC